MRNKVQAHLSFFYEVRITLYEFLQTYEEQLSRQPYDLDDLKGSVMSLDNDVDWFRSVYCDTVCELDHAAYLRRLEDFPYGHKEYLGE